MEKNEIQLDKKMPDQIRQLWEKFRILNPKNEKICLK